MPKYQLCDYNQLTRILVQVHGNISHKYKKHFQILDVYFKKITFL